MLFSPIISLFVIMWLSVFEAFMYILMVWVMLKLVLLPVGYFVQVLKRVMFSK